MIWTLLALAGPVDDAAAALSVRHDPPSCSAIEAMLDEPVPQLIQITELPNTAPAVAMRAARCLIRRTDTPVSLLEDWIMGVQTIGLAQETVRSLGLRPESERARLLEAIAQSPNAKLLQPLIPATDAIEPTVPAE